MQNATALQLTAVSAWAESISFDVQAEPAPSPGSLLATVLPEEVTATQVPLSEQETAISPVAVSAVAQDPLFVGFVLTRMFPLASTAAHSVLLAHETPNRAVVE